MLLLRHVDGQLQISTEKKGIEKMTDENQGISEKPEAGNVTIKWILGFSILFLIIGGLAGEGSPTLSKKEKESVCVEYVAAVLYKSPSIMDSVYIKDGFYEVSYTRNSDGTRWDAACHIDGKTIVWAAIHGGSLGRWRYEEDAKYKVSNTDNGKIVKVNIPNIGSLELSL